MCSRRCRMGDRRLLTGAAGLAIVSVLLLPTLPGAQTAPYRFWTASQMAELDRQLLSSMDAAKGSRVDMMSTERSFFMVEHREANSPSGEVHQTYADFAVVRSGEGGILAGGKLLDAKQSAAGE